MSIDSLQFSCKQKENYLFADLRLLDWDSDVSLLPTPVTDLPLRTSKSSK